MNMHTFTNKAWARAAADYIIETNGRAKIITIADGWLVMEFR